MYILQTKLNFFFFPLCKLGTSPVCWVQNFMYCSYIFSYVLFWGHKYCLSKKSHFLVTKKNKNRACSFNTGEHLYKWKSTERKNIGNEEGSIFIFQNSINNSKEKVNSILQIYCLTYKQKQGIVLILAPCPSWPFIWGFSI